MRGGILYLLIACGAVGFAVALGLIIATIESHIDNRNERAKTKRLPHDKGPLL